MTTIAAGGNAAIAIPVGYVLTINGVGTLVFGPGTQAGQPRGLTGVTRVGPFPAAQTVYVAAGAAAALLYSLAIILPSGRATVVSSSTPDDNDGMPDGTIYFQTS